MGATSSSPNTPSSLEIFVLFLAGSGGLIFLTAIIGLMLYLTMTAKLQWYTTSFYLLWIGILTAFIFTSVDLALQDPVTKQAIIITQGTILGICALLLGCTVYISTQQDIETRKAYIMRVIPVSLLISIVSLSATTMAKLSSA